MVFKSKSKIHGFGVFAKKRIPKNKKILIYAGEKVSMKELNRRASAHEDKGELWCFELNARWGIDGSVNGGMARFVNHAEKPNCWIDIEGEFIWYRAAKTIRPGQELTVNYGTDPVIS